MPASDSLGFWHFVIIAVVVLILFGGATRLPMFAKGLGQSIKIFKKEVDEVRDDSKQTCQGPRDDDRGAGVLHGRAAQGVRLPDAGPQPELIRVATPRRSATPSGACRSSSTSSSCASG